MRALKAVRQHLKSYHLKSGVFHFYRGEHGPAADFLTRALNEDGDRLSAADRRAALYYLVQTRIGAAFHHETRGDMDRAIAEYRSALEVMPRYPDVHLRLGDALARTGRHDEAIEHYEQAIEVNPLYVHARVRLGFAHLEKGDFEAARQAFREADQARRARAEQSLKSAEEALGRGQPEEAAAIYNDVFQENLARFKQELEEGLNHLRMERWEDAVTHLETAAELCPRYADVHNYLGVALAEQGRHKPAVQAFLASVKINPEYLVAWLNLAFVAFELGDEKLARQALGEVLDREADNAPAQYLLAQLGGAEGQSAALRPSKPAAQGRS
ncbi:MAG: tetratricopeptide repeat protein [Acidobacteriota bacterium]|nr:tetratricopeptide repeat protein [Acidobacteriota bacterium]